MLKTFKDDAKENPSPINLIIPHTHEILSLMDMIAQATPAACKRLKPPFEVGRMKGERSGCPRGLGREQGYVAVLS